MMSNLFSSPADDFSSSADLSPWEEQAYTDLTKYGMSKNRKKGNKPTPVNVYLLGRVYLFGLHVKPENVNHATAETLFMLFTASNFTQKVFLALNAEYGEPLTQQLLHDANFTHRKLLSDVITAGNTHYMERKKPLYTPSMLVVGVLESVGNGRYRLLDGYHRFEKISQENPTQKHVYIIAEKPEKP